MVTYMINVPMYNTVVAKNVERMLVLNGVLQRSMKMVNTCVGLYVIHLVHLMVSSKNDLCFIILAMSVLHILWMTLLETNAENFHQSFNKNKK